MTGQAHKCLAELPCPRHVGNRGSFFWLELVHAEVEKIWEKGEILFHFSGSVLNGGLQKLSKFDLLGVIKNWPVSCQ